MKTNKIYLFLIAFCILVIGCTDLEEDVLDETSPTNLTDKQAADGFISAVYARMPELFNHTNYFALQEISTDEAILPYRGGTDWGDNGIYISMHQHNFSTYDPNVNTTWNYLMQGVSRGTTAIRALPGLEDTNVQLYLAEARGMRAFYNMLLLDFFGLAFDESEKELIPIGEPTPLAKVLKGAEAVNYIESELLAVEPLLSEEVGPGRLTKSAAWGLLAKLYLNAAVYRDRNADSFNFASGDMDNVILYCDKIINSGKYTLSQDYFAIFNDENHTNKELIFAVDQRADLNGHNRLAYFSLSGDQFPLPAFNGANGTDGPAITPDFYDTWEDAYGGDPEGIDPRFFQKNMPAVTGCYDAAQIKMDRGILRGQQLGLQRDSKNAFLKCPDGKFQVNPLYNITRKKPNLPVNFTKQVDYTSAGSEHNTGYRVLKYEFSKKSDNGRNKGEADIIIIRLADVYMMRAEAKLRKNDDEAAALDDVNIVRASRTATTPAPALTEMSLDLLFRERGFEFYWEMQRRTDMIRFGKFEGTWTEKNNNDKTKRVFPIPQSVIDGSSITPGYLVQNTGY